MKADAIHVKIADGANVTDKIILNDYFRGDNDILHENNLDKILNLVNEIRLLLPEKNIWIYTGYKWEYIFDQRWHYHPRTQEKLSIGRWRRQRIVSQCDVLIDDQYIDSQRDISLKWRGSKNQRVIDIQKSLQNNKVVLYCD